MTVIVTMPLVINLKSTRMRHSLLNSGRTLLVGFLATVIVAMPLVIDKQEGHMILYSEFLWSLDFRRS